MIENEITNQINIKFAMQLLRSLYNLDRPLNELNLICAGMEDGPIKTQFANLLSDIMGDLLCDVMVPIYAAQPSLGRASEPGPWLADIKK